MLNLIKNEYQKIFAKAGTYIMLLLILAICVGYQLIIKLANSTGSWEPSRENIENTYEYYKDIAETDASMRSYRDLYKTMLTLEIYDADSYGDKQSWQGRALGIIFDLCYDTMNSIGAEAPDQEIRAAQETFDGVLESIKSNDFEKYCKTMIDSDFSYDNLKTRCQIALDMKISPDSFSYSLLDSLTASQLTLDKYKDLKEEDYDDAYYKAKTSFELAKYRIDHDLEYCITDYTSNDSYGTMFGDTPKYTFNSDFWSSIYNSNGLITLVTIMVVIVAGGIIASEYSQGTIKFLLINPVTRGKIFFSKYLTLLSLTAILSCSVFAINLITNLVIGSSGISARYLSFTNGTVVSTSAIAIVIVPYLMKLVEAVMIITLAFMISSLMRSSAMAIGISAGILLAGSSITSILALLNMDFGRFFFFANTNLVSIMNRTSMYPHHSLTFAIINLCVHWVVMLLIAYDGFTRKEI